MGFLDHLEMGRKESNLFLCLMGVSGVGKSTFASEAPNPIFLPTEDGTNNLNVTRLPKPKSFQDAKGMVSELQSTQHKYETLVIDSIDWMEPLIWAEVASEHNVKTVGDIPYGKGYEAATKKWLDLMHGLKALREKMNIIMIAHSQVKAFNDPVTGTSYDRYEIKLHQKAAGLVREAVDAVLFATFEVFTKKEGLKTRAFGDGARVLFTQHRPAHDGKNRFGLPYQLPLSWEEFTKAVKSGQPNSPSVIREEIIGMLESVTDDILKKTVLDTVEKAGMDAIQLAKIQNRLKIKLEG